MNDKEFQQRMAQLPEPPTSSRPPYWDYWRHELWTLGQSRSPESFAEWPCIRHTMLVDHFKADVRRQYYALPQEWRLLCKPPSVGRKDIFNDTYLSMNMINLAYHFWLYERITGIRIKDLDVITEFGGGFGAQALLARRTGFSGTYYVVDLPEFRLLQDWFLSKHDTSVSDGYFCPSDLFIGVYSISEMHPHDRDDFLMGHDTYLLLFSSNFAEYDNMNFFSTFAREREYMKWYTEQFLDRPDHYLIGWQHA